MSAIGITAKCGTTTLADGTESGGQVVDAIIVNNRRVIEVQEFIRASAVTIFARGNKRNEVRFTVDRGYADLLASRKAQFDQGETLAERADLTLIFTDGVDTLTVLLPAAGWETVEAEYNGVSLRTQFNVLGGKFQTTLASAADTPDYSGGTAGSGTSFDRFFHGGCCGDGGQTYRTLSGGTAGT